MSYPLVQAEGSSWSFGSAPSKRATVRARACVDTALDLPSLNTLARLPPSLGTILFAFQYDPLCRYRPGFRCNGPQEGDLELGSRLSDAILERRLDG
jgi:hypothetical protein